MKLADWLKLKGLKPSDFAKSLGFHTSTITRALNGKRRPEWPTMDAIQQATSGAVMPNDFASEATAERANG